jgi:predicted aldo/keto reductase-like oxidoreductase
MIYREYGSTGKKVSTLGFGGMRFNHIDDEDECVRMMLKAARGGITYYDTAPGYFGGKSEAVFGKGFAEFRRQNLPYYVSTKTFATTEADIRREVDAQLKRLDVPAIDFYHIWCVTNLQNWEARKKDGILDTLRKLKDEGLIRHICVSSHLVRDEIETLLMEGVFDGVLFGYSAYNYTTREKAFDAIRAKKLGAVVMNPLGGGIIPQHPELFTYLQQRGEPVVQAGLHFLWDHPDLTTTLVGFGVESDIDDALAAMEHYQPRTAAQLAEVKSKAFNSFEGVCTGCSYCLDDCPQEIPIPKYMDTYNQKLLLDKTGTNGNRIMAMRLQTHWTIGPEKAAECVACGNCESACTQHLDIIERLKVVAQVQL